ncbi:MAG: ADP-ribosylglycohydrolase family protein [Gemmatimonadales bacterium]|nr:ADP-ribosylglycohydrolase family protein [Gemmatimonadales bacterium]MBA3553615.1 ADP-ribosylglycohydrolase family protein [Gemmatimonadales bacterium]
MADVAGRSVAESLAGCLLGLALGDALGFVVEAQPPAVARGYVSGWLRTGRAGEREHPDYQFGQYSDDTQLARELLLSVRDAGGWDPARFGERVGALILSGRDVGAGPGTRSAGLRILLGAPWEHAGTPAPYAGNGAAMRAGPIGLLFGGDPERWRRCAREQSRVTHRDPRCTAGAVAIAGAVALGAQPGPVRAGDFLARLAAWVEPEDRSMALAIADLGTWTRLEPESAAQRLHVAESGISPFVVPSVLWSLYAFLRSPDDYWEAVCTAIAVGGDTDTMAAMTGAIAGGRLGTGALPPALVARLNDRGTWDSAALSRLARECAGSA